MAARPRAREESDDELMRRVQHDDAVAFGRLYDRYADRALRIACSVCSERGRAEDAVQEGFLSMWRGRAVYEPARGSFPVWSMQAVRNRALDSRWPEAAGHRPPPAEGHHQEPAASAASLPDEAAARSERRDLHGHLRELPAAQAEVIALAFFGELSQTEIAEHLCVPHGTVKGRMRLGMEKLRIQLRAEG